MASICSWVNLCLYNAVQCLRICDFYRNNMTLLIAHHKVALALQHQLYGIRTHF